MNTTFATIEVGQYGLESLIEKVADLNKRAAKHGLEPVKVDVLRTVAFVAMRKAKFGQSVPLHTVAISGVEPCIAGWRMVGKIEFDPVIGNMVKAIGDDNLDVRYRTIEPICEHCNSKRHRKDIFILRHESGEEKVVGRNCLADFIRDGDAETLARFAEFAERIGEFTDSEHDCDYECWGGEGHRAPYVTVQNYLAMVSCIIRKFGWTSKAASRNLDNVMPTTYWAGCCYFGRKTAEFIEKHDLYPTDKDAERACNAIAWAKTKQGDVNNYLDSIGRLAAVESVLWRYDGYLASVISAYSREMELEIERRKQKAVRCFIGNVGERLKGLPVEVVRLRFIDGYYGTRTIVTLETPVGDKRAVLTWFASGDKDSAFSEGDKLVVDATVKKHEHDDKYGDSTIVTRVTVKG